MATVATGETLEGLQAPLELWHKWTRQLHAHIVVNVVVELLTCPQNCSPLHSLVGPG